MVFDILSFDSKKLCKKKKLLIKKYYFCTVKNAKIRDYTPDFYIKMWSIITKFKRFYVQENIQY